MTSQLFSSMSRFEAGIIATLSKGEDRRLAAHDLYSKVIRTINQDIAKENLTEDLLCRLRLCIKLNPYSSELVPLTRLHDRMYKLLMEARMPGLFDIIRQYRAKNVPIPVIVSCEKYLSKARVLQEKFAERYFSISPIIVKGDISLSMPSFQDGILSLPVADSYEALPVKVLEMCVFFQAMDERCGIIKIDDDMLLKPIPPLNVEEIAHIFTLADYMGLPIDNLFQDRTWHLGKCSQTTPSVYGKPIKSVWGRGAFYFLSHYALEKLAHYYLRFPGCLDGEMYEDKAVGDILYDNTVMLVKYALEDLLGIDSMSMHVSA